MEAYLYKYKCPGTWFGNYEGLRNAYTSEVLNDKQAVDMAKNDLKRSNNLRDCSVILLVKYNTFFRNKIKKKNFNFGLI